MKLLWITNTLFPDICKEMCYDIPVINGWVISSAKAILTYNKQVELAVASPYSGKYIIKKKINNVTYFLFPNRKNLININSKTFQNWIYIKNEFKPDIIHIHGTEYVHGLNYMNACGNEGVVISIQGLINIVEKYYYGGIEEKIIHKNITLRDRIKSDSLIDQKFKMRKRGLLEIELINKSKNIIGRTSWDKSHALAINPNIKYYKCNELLRDIFYINNWSINKCEKYSIFISQAYYPIKGLHQLLKALPLILRKFPETMVYIGGIDFITNRGWKINGYGNYIKTLIKENKLEEKVIFTGVLNEKEMCKRYLLSHVFVCPSSIENSPNSIGEAQILGVPCVASFVGGISDMISDKKSGLLYRFEEVEMLASSVCEIFSNDKLALKLSIECKIEATSRHDKLLNTENLMSIYKSILNNNRQF